MKYLGLLLLGLFISSCGLRKTFPKFDLQDHQGRQFDESVFNQKRTLVIMGHISCPPMLEALKGFSNNMDIIDSSGVQVIAILENTEGHIQQFYNDTASIWGMLKNIFKVDTIQFPLLPECDTENIKRKDSITTIGNHCRKLSWKVWTFSSPTLFIIDENRKILKRRKGYPLYASQEECRKWIRKFLKEE